MVETIRQQLAAGYSADQVVEGLMGGGLSRHSAERFVQRAGGQVQTVVPPPVPPAAMAPPPLPMEAPSAFAAEPFAAETSAQGSMDAESLHPVPPPLPSGHAFASPAAAVSPAKPMNALKLVGGGALLLVGVALLALSLSSSGRVRLKVPLALVFGGGATLVQALRER